MGIDIWILAGKNYHLDRTNCVYSVSYATHDEISARYSLIEEIVNLADRPHKRIYPRKFIPFIVRLEEEKARTEQEEKTKEQIKIDSSQKETFYGILDTFLNGLKRARNLRKPISIDGLV